MRRLVPGLLLLAAACSAPPSTPAPRPAASPVQASYRAAWNDRHDRIWIGPDAWANRLQDWRLRGGRAECVGTRLPYRTLHLLTHRAEGAGSSLQVQVRLGAIGEGVPDGAEAGILIGAGSAGLDARAASLVQSAPGPGGGVLAGINGRGELFVRDFGIVDGALDERTVRTAFLGKAHLAGTDLRVAVAIAGGKASVTATAHGLDGRPAASVALTDLPAKAVRGNLALCSHRGAAPDRGHWFADWRAEGDLLREVDNGGLGPILSTLHTISRGVLKLTAQLLPVAPEDGREVVLEVLRAGRWLRLQVAPLDLQGYVATFRVEPWNAESDVPFRVLYDQQSRGARVERHEYRGVLRREPRAEKVVLAALTCCHQVRHGFGQPGLGFGRDTIWFPHQDISTGVAARQPDLLFFAGDQIYEGASPTPVDRSEHAALDYLYKWYLWCWAFRELTAQTPTVVLPDDHDVFQGNLWGAGGRAAKRDHQGGYVMPADWVKMVERTQVSHLPDPYDATPIEQGIGACYTSLRWGGVDFAILEDRKWKSGPAGLVAHDGRRPDHITDPAFDVAGADVPGAELLGERQLRFLRAWAADWRGVQWKATLSQTIFAGLATEHSTERDIRADLDSNGWPQSGRNEALRAIRRAFAPMIGGDQHLASVVRHGVEQHGDAGSSFCVPAIANFYPRAWRPAQPGGNRPAGAPDHTGEHLDCLGNRVTVLAVANPEPTDREPQALYGGMPGWGAVVFDKTMRTVTYECWPRHALPGRDAQYAGWPVTLTQRDQYGRAPAAFLPTLEVSGIADPVVQVRDAQGELVYALRVRGQVFQPWTFAPGAYRVTVGEPGGTVRELDLEATGQNDERVRIAF